MSIKLDLIANVRNTFAIEFPAGICKLVLPITFNLCMILLVDMISLLISQYELVQEMNVSMSIIPTHLLLPFCWSCNTSWCLNWSLVSICFRYTMQKTICLPSCQVLNFLSFWAVKRTTKWATIWPSTSMGGMVEGVVGQERRARRVVHCCCASKIDARERVLRTQWKPSTAWIRVMDRHEDKIDQLKRIQWTLYEPPTHYRLYRSR